MPAIDLDDICHKLAIDPRDKPIVQNKRKVGEETQKVCGPRN